MSDRVKAAAEACAEAAGESMDSGDVSMYEAVLRPFIPDPSGDMKACAEEIEEFHAECGCGKCDYCLLNPPKYENNVDVESILSRYWPDKPELAIESAAKKILRLTPQRSFVTTHEMEIFASGLTSVLSDHFMQAQGVDVEALAKEIEWSVAECDRVGHCQPLPFVYESSIRKAFADIGPFKETMEIFKMENDLLKLRIAELKERLQSYEVVCSSCESYPCRCEQIAHEDAQDQTRLD